SEQLRRDQQLLQKSNAAQAFRERTGYLQSLVMIIDARQLNEAPTFAATLRSSAAAPPGSPWSSGRRRSKTITKKKSRRRNRLISQMPCLDRNPPVVPGAPSPRRHAD